MGVVSPGYMEISLILGRSISTLKLYFSAKKCCMHYIFFNSSLILIDGRGGDFHRRQAAGEHPKQLNYSRAFGGKDLKMFGLIAEPDISHFEITPDDKLVLLASDGLWDVLNPKVACEIALEARRNGRNATEEVFLFSLVPPLQLIVFTQIYLGRTVGNIRNA